MAIESNGKSNSDTTEFENANKQLEEIQAQ